MDGKWDGKWGQNGKGNGDGNGKGNGRGDSWTQFPQQRLGKPPTKTQSIFPVTLGNSRLRSQICVGILTFNASFINNGYGINKWSLLWGVCVYVCLSVCLDSNALVTMGWWWKWWFLLVTVVVVLVRPVCVPPSPPSYPKTNKLMNELTQRPREFLGVPRSERKNKKWKNSENKIDRNTQNLT